MDLKHLHTFLTLCEFRNFTKTALEKGLDTRLFERLGKRVSLTVSGRELVQVHYGIDYKIVSQAYHHKDKW